MVGGFKKNSYKNFFLIMWLWLPFLIMLSVLIDINSNSESYLHVMVLILMNISGFFDTVNDFRPHTLGRVWRSPERVFNHWIFILFSASRKGIFPIFTRENVGRAWYFCTHIHVYMLFLDRPHVCVSIRSWYVRTCAATLYHVLVICVWPVIHPLWRRYLGITWIAAWQWA